MARQTAFFPQFVELIPEVLEEGVLYVSVRYKTACHRCSCGCGGKVVTPLTPTGWRITYDGRTVSLYPSIGNWKLACQSHYWITNNRVKWAEGWTADEIAEGFAHDTQLKETYYEKQGEAPIASEQPSVDAPKQSRLRRLFGRWLPRR